MKIAIYPGSFDPITFGHIDIVERATSLFDKVILGVAESQSKNPLFSVDERIELISDIFKDNSKIEAIGYSKQLTVDLARDNNAIAIIRGLRAVADFEYEFQLATMNRSLAPDIESIFFTPKDTLIYVSSSLVKEIATFGGDVSRFVPENVKVVFWHLEARSRFLAQVLCRKSRSRRVGRHMHASFTWRAATKAIALPLAQQIVQLLAECMGAHRFSMFK